MHAEMRAGLIRLQLAVPIAMYVKVCLLRVISKPTVLVPVAVIIERPLHVLNVQSFQAVDNSLALSRLSENCNRSTWVRPTSASAQTGVSEGGGVEAVFQVIDVKHIRKNPIHAWTGTARGVGRGKRGHQQWGGYDSSRERSRGIRVVEFVVPRTVQRNV